MASRLGDTRAAKMRFRSAALVAAISVMVLLLAWAAHASWQLAHAIHERLGAVQSESFHQVNHFQQAVLNLDAVLLRCQIRNDAGAWQQFVQDSQALARWIATQTPEWNSRAEKQVLDQLNAAFQAFMLAARQIDSPLVPAALSDPALVKFAHFENASQALLHFGYELANAHRKALGVFLSQSDRSLNHLQFLSLGLLVLLLLFGLGLAWVIYREMIAPLRLQLVESRELAERHEKLASLGMLAAGVAHEIRNPLTAVKARLFILQRLLLPDTHEHAHTSVIGQEITRLERILNDFLLFARPSDPVLQPVPAQQLLADVQALLAPQLEKANIRLAIEGNCCVRVNVDAQQIQQVLINLVQNAADSIGHDGSVILRARLDRKRWADQTMPTVVLEVADTGPGIPPDVQKKLFDPFFTTKAGGTGLGLSIAARIVQKHGGALQFQTQVNAGTTFGIVLPHCKSSSGMSTISAPTCQAESIYEKTNPDCRR